MIIWNQKFMKVKKVSKFKNDLLCILSMEFHSILPSKSLVIVFSIITLSKYQLNSGLGLAFVTTHRTSDLSATASRRTSAGSRARVTSKTLSTLGKFHQHFTSSFYAHRSQKRQKDSQVKQLFALLGSVSIKAARKHVKDLSTLSFKDAMQYHWPMSLCVMASILRIQNSPEMSSPLGFLHRHLPALSELQLRVRDFPMIAQTCST